MNIFCGTSVMMLRIIDALHHRLWWEVMQSQQTSLQKKERKVWFDTRDLYVEILHK